MSDEVVDDWGVQQGSPDLEEIMNDNFTQKDVGSLNPEENISLIEDLFRIFPNPRIFSNIRY